MRRMGNGHVTDLEVVGGLEEAQGGSGSIEVAAGSQEHQEAQGICQ